MGPCGSGRVCGSDWVGCTGRGEARGSRELCACAGRRMLCYVMKCYDLLCCYVMLRMEIKMKMRMNIKSLKIKNNQILDHTFVNFWSIRVSSLGPIFL